jgi:tetratricopeptide (TPR) repeat protein
MKISFRRYRIAWLAALVLALGVLPARAQPPEQTPLEKAQAVLKTMRDENLSASQAFESGLLTKDVLLFVLGENGLLDRQPGQWQDTPETSAWTQLFVEKFPELAVKPAELPTAVQIKIARWYFSKNDGRGAAIMESVLKNLSRENPDLMTVNTAIFHLSDYYKSIGETEKSIATSLKMQEFTKDANLLVMNVFRAAQTASTAGETARARQLYEQVIGYNSDHFTGEAIIGLARELSREGKLQEARALLQKPVEGENADEIRLQLENELVQSYFHSGEWDEAQKWAKTFVEHYDALKSPNKTGRWQWLADNARRVPQQIEQWKKSPARLFTPIIAVRVAAAETEPMHISLNVQSYRDITVKAISNHPAIGVFSMQLPESYVSNTYQMLDVEIAPAAFPQNPGDETKAEITVSVAEFPDTVFHVPVTITWQGETP